MQEKATKVKVTANHKANGYLTVGKYYNIEDTGDGGFWLKPDNVGGQVFCSWEDCCHGYEYEPVYEDTKEPYWDYMLKDGQGDKEMSTIEVGSKWICTVDYPWGASLKPGDVVLIRSADGEDINYWHGGQRWAGCAKGWHDKFKLLPNTPKEDQVDHPSHYNESGVECIDAIRASLGPDGFQAYCKGNCMKYLWRYQYKNGLEDLKKAQVYLNWMVESMEDTTDG